MYDVYQRAVPQLLSRMGRRRLPGVRVTSLGVPRLSLGWREGPHRKGGLGEPRGWVQELLGPLLPSVCSSAAPWATLTLLNQDGKSSCYALGTVRVFCGGSSSTWGEGNLSFLQPNPPSCLCTPGEVQSLNAPGWWGHQHSLTVPKNLSSPRLGTLD